MHPDKKNDITTFINTLIEKLNNDALMSERIDQKEYRIQVKNTFLRYGIVVKYTPSVTNEVFEEPVCYFQNNQLKFYYMDFTTDSEIGMLIQDLIMESNRNIKRQIIREADTEFTKLLKLLN